MSAATSRSLINREILLVALSVTLLIATVAGLLIPGVPFGVVWPTGDILINEAASMIAFIAAWLAWTRYRALGDASAAYQAAGFLLFAISSAAQLMASLGFFTFDLKLEPTNPGQAPLYAWTIVRLIAAGLLLQAGRVRLRPPDSAVERPTIGVALGLGAAAAAFLFVYGFESLLPPLVDSASIVAAAEGTPVSGQLAGSTAAEIALNGAVIFVLGAAAVSYAMSARRGLSTAGYLMAAGLIVAAFAQLHFALFPGVYARLFTSSDLLRLGFYGFVLLAIQAEAGATLRQLRSANRELNDLREAEVAHASLAERARLAREVHDGLAQNLWLAKLTTERLGKVKDVDEVAEIQQEIDGLLDAGIDEARQTVLALRDASRTQQAFGEVLARQVQRFEERTGVTARLTLQGLDHRPLPARTAAELLRIAQEAMTNVRRHADATVLSVAVDRSADRVALSVRDNGVGFDPTARRGGFGLESMRERAELIGGQLTVQSSASAGTTIQVVVPAAAS